MYLEIVTPEAVLFSGNVTSVIVPGEDGEFQMLDNHAPIISLLSKGKVKVYGDMNLEEEVAEKFTKENGATTLAITSGTVEMKENKVIILAD